MTGTSFKQRASTSTFKHAERTKLDLPHLKVLKSKDTGRTQQEATTQHHCLMCIVYNAIGSIVPIHEFRVTYGTQEPQSPLSKVELY